MDALAALASTLDEGDVAVIGEREIARAFELAKDGQLASGDIETWLRENGIDPDAFAAAVRAARELKFEPGVGFGFGFSVGLLAARMEDAE